MNEFKKYRRTQIAEMRDVTQRDVNEYYAKGDIEVEVSEFNRIAVSISAVDRSNGSPKIGDMIARNPKNHKDQWLVAKDYFEENFEKVTMSFGGVIIGMGEKDDNVVHMNVLKKMVDKNIRWLESKRKKI